MPRARRSPRRSSRNWHIDTYSIFSVIPDLSFGRHRKYENGITKKPRQTRNRARPIGSGQAASALGRRCRSLGWAIRRDEPLIRRAERTARDPKLKSKYFMRKPDAVDKLFGAGAKPPIDWGIKQPKPPPGGYICPRRSLRASTPSRARRGRAVAVKAECDEGADRRPQSLRARSL
jgi:hypothetical protein